MRSHEYYGPFVGGEVPEGLETHWTRCHGSGLPGFVAQIEQANPVFVNILETPIT